MGKLFRDVESLRIGIGTGEHVIHIIAPNDDKAVTLYEVNEADENLIMHEDDDYLNMGESDERQYAIESTIDGDTKNVNQAQVYNNKSNKDNAKFFAQMAMMADNYYDLTNDDDKDFRVVLENVRDYLYSSSRSNQQKMAGKILESIHTFNEKADNILLGNDDKNIEKIEKFRLMTSELENSFQSRFMGNLAMDDVNQKIQNSIRAKDIEEPSYSGFSGAISVWSDASDKQLFPHEPNSTDIKQGVGIQDCFMHASLIKIADTNPEKIKNAMKDNGDGTVTVRFFDNEKNPETDEMERVPVYVRVKKTESNVLHIGASYAAGSLWAQMMEKAYAKYNDMQLEKRGMKPQGLAGINRGNSRDFLNAFEENPVYTANYMNNRDIEGIGILPDGTINHAESEVADLYCDKMYDFLKDNPNETIVVGADQRELNGKIKDLGIRTGHAYPIMKVFEENGEKYVQLRDPYATYEAAYDKDGKLVDATSNADWLSRGIHAGGDNMGTFNLKMRDFAAIYTNFTGISNEKLAEYTKNVTDVCLAKKRELDKAKKENEIANEENNQKASGKSDFLNDFEIVGDKKDIADGFEVIDNKKDIADGFEVIDNKKDIADGFEVIDNKKDIADGFEVLDNKKAVVNGFEVIDENELNDKAKKGPVIRDEFGKIRHAMDNYLADLKRVESKWKNSDIYENLKKEVSNLSKYDVILDKSENWAKEYKQQLDKISGLVDQYVDHKKSGADLTSQNKLAVALKLKAYVNKKANPDMLDEAEEKRDKEIEKESPNKQRLSFNEFVNEDPENVARANSFTSRSSVKSLDVNDYKGFGNK